MLSNFANSFFMHLIGVIWVREVNCRNSGHHVVVTRWLYLLQFEFIVNSASDLPRVGEMTIQPAQLSGGYWVIIFSAHGTLPF